VAAGKADPDLTTTDPIGNSPDQPATTTSAATEGARTMFSGVSGRADNAARRCLGPAQPGSSIPRHALGPQLDALPATKVAGGELASVDVSRRRTERLVNLVLCLLSTRRFLTAGQIARIVSGYEHDENDPKAHEAFQRMFERDKAELRELGVPLETGTTSVFDTEPGYRIARRDYALPEIHLEPDEAAAVGLAARLWQHAGLASSASSGLLKLRATGLEVEDSDAAFGIEPVVGDEAALEPMLAAINARQVVRFPYRTPMDDTANERRLQPWGAVSWRGRWYVVGHDLDRDATRCFRLSRVAGPVTASGQARAFTPPEGVNLLEHVASGDEEPARRGSAVLRLRPGVGAGLRRWADAVDRDDDGWDVVTLPLFDAESFAGRLAGYGASVVVQEPPELRDALLRRLDRLAGTDRSGHAAGRDAPPGVARADRVEESA
jgi:proteasome accessory factor B